MKICVYAICKNEEKFVPKWVESMKEADEIYVLDTGSTDNTVATTQVSFLKSFGNNGLNGLSIALEVKIALSVGFPSLLVKLPGILPTAYSFSS